MRLACMYTAHTHKPTRHTCAVARCASSWSAEATYDQMPPLTTQAIGERERERQREKERGRVRERER